jgi:hypothetical protein
VKFTERWRFKFKLQLNIRLDSITLPNCKEIKTSSIKLRFDKSSRTSLTGLSAEAEEINRSNGPYWNWPVAKAHFNIPFHGLYI